MSQCKLYKNTDSAFTEFLNANNSQLNKFIKSWPSSQIGQIEACNISNPGGGYFRQFRISVCRQGSQTLTLFKGRKSRIDTLFKAQNQEMAPYFTEEQAINVL